MADFFRIFQPVLYFYFTFRKYLLRYYEKKYWKNNSLPELNTIKPITGTFIYPIPPDYPGLSTHLWRMKDWIHEFERLKQQLGIDTIILNGSVAETNTRLWYIFYPMSIKTKRKFSSLERRLNRQPIIKKCVDTILQAAEQTDMSVHLGLFNVLDQWYENPTNDFLNETTEQEIAVAEDLVSLYGDFQVLKGWYISPEIMYILHGRHEKLDMNEFLRPIGHFLKTNTPKLHVGISPGTLYNRFISEKVRYFWLKTLQNSGVDLLYPQDSVGWLNVFPYQSPYVWKLYKEIADKLNITLWGNCETFEWNNFSKDHPFIAAPFRRLIWQLQNVSPFVEKIVTWEAMYFLNHTGAINGKQLYYDYKKYFKQNRKIEG